MKKKLFIVSLAIAGIILLPACGTNNSSANDSVNSKLLARYMDQQIDWTKCASELLIDKDYYDQYFDFKNALCAQVKVPADYQDLEIGNEEFVIQLMKDPANTDIENPENLFINPGGPGGSGVDYVQYMQASKTIRDNLNIIGFDPRGVKSSSEIRCDDNLDLQSYYSTDYFIDTQEEVDFADAEIKKYYDDCAQKNPLWYLINTENTVRDLDILRQVVSGDSNLNFAGSSYGTTIAAEYIRLFPDKVGKILMDSPTQNDLTDEERNQSDAKAQEASLKRLLDKCATDTKCPGQTAEEVALKINEAILRADNDDLVGVYGVKNHPDYDPGTYASGYLLFEGIFQMTYYPTDDIYEEFKAAMLQLENGEYSKFEFYGLSYHGYDPEKMTRTNSDEILMIVNCLDEDSRDFYTQAELDSQEQKYKEIAPLSYLIKKGPIDFDYIPEKQGCEWSWRAFEDENIPDPPKEFPSPQNESGKQILIVASKGDNATPYSGAVRMAGFMKSPLVTYEGDGHGVAFGTSDCLTKIVDEFILTGKVPAANISCPVKIENTVTESEPAEKQQQVKIESCLYYQYVNEGEESKEDFGKAVECGKTEYRLGYCATIDSLKITTFSSRNDVQYDGKDIDLSADEIWQNKVDSEASCDSRAWADAGFDVDPPYYGFEVIRKDSRNSNVPNREFFVSFDGCCGSDVYMIETKEVSVS
jgi:pimeloyl-ACP methyl ester carboxylesterase